MTKTGKKPGKIARFILESLLPQHEAYYLIGDFEEEFSSIHDSRGIIAANLMFWRLIIASLPGFIFNSIYWSIAMFKNYLKITLRNMKRNKGFTFINVFGLASGIAICLLILLYVKYEMSYDRFPERANSIYRVALERTYPDRIRSWGWTATALADDVERDIPEVIGATRILNEMGETQISYEDNRFIEDNVLYAEADFFDFFSIPLIEGDPKTALSNLNSVVLTRKAAQKYFGQEDPMGKTLLVRNWYADNTGHVITGIVEDLPRQSHFHYDFLISYKSSRVSENSQWGYWQVFNYLLLQDGVEHEVVEEKFHDLVAKYMGPLIEEDGTRTFEDFLAAGNKYRFILQPLKDIHLRSKLEHELESNGNILYLYIFSVLAGFILIIACINFMNLSTARSLSRAKEVGVRKALGSVRRQLITQFIMESILLSFVSLIFALIFVEISLPVFSLFTGTNLDLNYSNILLIPGFIIFAVILGLISGSYPAFFLSSFNPVSVLKNNRDSDSGGMLIRNCLVVFQFASSIALIAATLIVSNQIDYMLTKDLGFNQEHVVVISNGNALGEKFRTFKEELKKHPTVIDVAGCGQYPTEASHTFNVGVIGTNVSASVYNTAIGYDFIETLDLKIVKGNSFSPEMASDSNGVILNEAAVRILGLEEPVGTLLDTYRQSVVIGVVKDYNFKSLHYEIGPLILFNSQDRVTRYVSVRIKPDDTQETLTLIKSNWDDFTDAAPFNYSFMDMDMEKHYNAETKTGQVSAIFSVLAIVIGCLGLFGLAAYMAEQRTKEIGIRKVLGASATNVFHLLTKDFVKLVMISVVIAVPITYSVMNNWLGNFAFRTYISYSTFIIAGGLTLIIAILTVSYQVLKVVNHNPVDSLRHE